MNRYLVGDEWNARVALFRNVMFRLVPSNVKGELGEDYEWYESKLLSSIEWKQK
jgi:hypothetical protein